MQNYGKLKFQFLYKSIFFRHYKKITKTLKTLTLIALGRIVKTDKSTYSYGDKVRLCTEYEQAQIEEENANNNGIHNSKN